MAHRLGQECTDVVQRAAEIWLSAKNRRKPRSPKESKVLIILTQPCVKIIGKCASQNLSSNSISV